MNDCEVPLMTDLQRLKAAELEALRRMDPEFYGPLAAPFVSQPGESLGDEILRQERRFIARQYRAADPSPRPRVRRVPVLRLIRGGRR